VTSPITFSGLASGIDSAALIDALVKVAQVPISKLQTQKSNFSSQSKQISDIKTKLTTLQTATAALDTKGEALGNKSTSSNTSVLSVTAAGGAAMGTFKIEVTSLAQAERTYSNPVSGQDTAGLVGAGTLSLKVGSGDAVNVEVTADDTLTSIAKKINSSGAALSAGVVNDGKGNYRLQVSATQSGAANGITFTEGGSLSLGLTDPLNEKQPAADAVVKIDGMEISSASNTVSGAVPGVTLNLTDVGTSVVKVDRDGDGLKTKLNTFVTAYNDVMKTLNAAFTYTGVTKGADSLAGDSTMKQVQSQLRDLVSKVTSNGDSSLTMLSSIGISTARDGTLTLDDTKYTAAVAKDYEGVASLLAGRTDGTGLMKQISDGLTNYTKADGSLKIKIDNLAQRNRNIDKQITTVQSRIDKYQETLQKQYAALEQTISGLNGQSSSLSNILASA
jgi:flagellar hook-associated protein 2